VPMKYTSRFAFRFMAATCLTLALATSALAAKDPVAKPMSAWLVGPSQASSFDKSADGPGCLMVTEFDNGMIVGVHAREAGIVGMTVDTGEKNMTPGQARRVGLNIGADSYALNGVASDDSTLSLNLEEAGGGKRVAERLTGLGNFRLLIDEKPYYFATTGFTDGLARLQACMGGTMAVPVVVEGPGDTAGKIKQDVGIEAMRVTSSGHETPLALALPSLIPTGYRFTLEDVNPMTPISWQAGDDWVDVMRKALAPHGLKMAVQGNDVLIGKRAGSDEPVVENVQAADQLSSDDVVALAGAHMPAVPVAASAAAEIPVGVWGGAKGEKLADVLEAWGLMSGVNVKVDLDGDYKLPEDVRYEGRFDEAVQKLLAEFDDKNRPSGTFLGLANARNAPSAGAVARAARMPRAPLAGERVVATVSPDADSGWRPMKKAKALDPSVKTFAPAKQMRPIPDPADAPKTVQKTDRIAKLAGKAKTSGTWTALEGTSLRDVLEQWGKDAHVQVVWQSNLNFPLPETIKKKGKFEDAVMDALAQYEDQGVRPTAQLNRDPDTGAKALIIKTSRL